MYQAIKTSGFLVAVVIFNGLLYAQNLHCDCLIKGLVIDQQSKQPIAGALLQLKSTSQKVMSDSAGRYKIEHLCQGDYILECRILGYKSIKTKVSLLHSAEENINLSEEEIHLADVQISAQRINQIAQTQTILQGKELEKTLGQTLAQSLSSVVGVSTLQTGSSIAKPVIQGLHSNRVLILNNGIRQEGQQWGSEHAPEIDPFVAKRITVVKGASSVRYGSDAIGGVVLVEPAPLPKQKGWQAEANTMGFSNGQVRVASTSVEGGIPQLSGAGWRLQGTLKNGGNIQTPFYYLANTGVREQNFSVGFGYQSQKQGIDIFYSSFKSELGIFSGSHIGNISDLLMVISKGEPLIKSDFKRVIENPRQEINHDLLKVRAFRNIDDNKLSLTLARQANRRAEYDLHNLQQTTDPSLRFQITTYTADALIEHKPLKQKFTGQGGISGLYQFNFTDGRPLIPDFEQINVGGFLTERLVKPEWEWEAGIRYDWRWLRVYHFIQNQLFPKTHQFKNWSGSIGGVYKPQANWLIRANISSAWRPPTPNELYSKGVHHGAAAYEEGLPTLKSEVAYHAAGSIVYSYSKLKIEAETYYKWIQNYIYLQPQSEPVLTIRGAFPAFKYTQTQATFVGTDLTTNWHPTYFLEHTLKLSYLRAYDRAANQYLAMIPANRIENIIDIKIGSRQNMRPLSIAVKHLWVAKQNRVSLNSDYMLPPASYHLWGFSIDKDWKPTPKSILKAMVEVQNLFDNAYRDYMNRFRYYTIEQGRNIIIKLKYNFQA